MKKQKLPRIFFAFTLVLALVAPSLLSLKPHKVEAGTMTSASLTVSDSRAAQTAVTYTMAMSATDSASLIKQVDIYFCTTAVGTCTAPTGLDTGTPEGTTSIAGSSPVFSKISAAANTARIVIGTPAAEDPVDFNIVLTGVTNPTSAASMYARVTTYSDTGTTVLDTVTVATAIISSYGLAVTGEVGPVFTFSIAGVNTSSTVNGATTNVTTTSLSIPFGGLAAGTAKIAAHDLAVATNADNGYKITSKALADPPLVSGSNNIDKFSGSNGTPASWSAPDSTTPNTNTGFFGYTTEDATLDNTGDGVDRFGSDLWAGANNSAEIFVYNNDAPTGTETTRVGWKAEVNNYQPAGAYTGTVVLVATPTY